jgi:hypothetical protein
MPEFEVVYCMVVVMRCGAAPEECGKPPVTLHGLGSILSDSLSIPLLDEKLNQKILEKPTA